MTSIGSPRAATVPTTGYLVESIELNSNYHLQLRPHVHDDQDHSHDKTTYTSTLVESLYYRVL